MLFDIFDTFYSIMVCLGEILAKQLASLGAKLILSARNETELERVRKQLTGMPEVWVLAFSF